MRRGEDAAAPAPLRTSDGSLTLRAPGHGESYRSVHGALREARSVFVEGAGVAARLDAGRATRVLELGFGTAWSFLASAERARGSGTPLSYLAFERAPLGRASLAALEHGPLLDERETLDALLAAIGAAEAQGGAGANALRGRTLRVERPPVALELRMLDLRAARLPRDAFDAVYLDPFSPRVEPESWGADVLATLHAALVPGGRLATYSVQGRLRRELAALGFDVAKRPGPPGKREILVATRR